jgi:hypothetical protein
LNRLKGSRTRFAAGCAFFCSTHPAPFGLLGPARAGFRHTSKTPHLPPGPRANQHGCGPNRNREATCRVTTCPIVLQFSPATFLRLGFLHMRAFFPCVRVFLAGGFQKSF